MDLYPGAVDDYMYKWIAVQKGPAKTGTATDPLRMSVGWEYTGSACFKSTPGNATKRFEKGERYQYGDCVVWWCGVFSLLRSWGLPKPTPTPPESPMALYHLATNGSR